MSSKSAKSSAIHPLTNQRPRQASKSVRLLLLMLSGAALGAGGAQAYTAPSTNQVVVLGNHFLKDGVPWVSKGFNFQGLLCPDQNLTTCESGMITSAQIMDAQGVNEFTAAQSWGADTARFLVSQAALDPDSAYYQSWYLPYITGWIRTARSMGFVVVISMQWEPGSLETGWQQQLSYPSHPTSNAKTEYSSTVRAWQQVAPLFATDNGVMFEAFNEVGTTYSSTVSWAKAWSTWATNFQYVIQEIRSVGANNVILLQGLQTGHTFQNMPSPNGLIDPSNPTDPQFAYTVHPYEIVSTNKYTVASLTPTDFATNFGTLSLTAPVMISEVSGTWANACEDGGPGVPATQAYMNGSQGIMNYAKSMGIGISGAWGFDSYGTMVANLTGTTSTWVPLDFSTFNGCYGVDSPVNAAGPGYDFQQYYLTGVIPTVK
jgi:cellulase (glycosyl hydrolase family 5)